MRRYLPFLNWPRLTLKRFESEFMAGLTVGLGALRQGWLMDLVSSPVLMAFTQAAALLIITSQVPAMLGLSWADASVQSWHVPSAVLGLLSLAFILACKRLRPSVPAVFFLLVMTAGAAWWWGWDASGIAVVGDLPGGFPPLGLPALPDVQTLMELAVPALVIALVSFMETAASARVDNAQSGQRWDRDQDLIGQGAGKLTAALCGAFPTSTSFSRSALNLFAGSQSGWSNVFCCVVVAVVLAVGLPVLAWVPRAVLSAVVVASVLGLLKLHPWKLLWRTSRRDLFVAVPTLVVTYAAAPSMYWGIVAGLVLSLLIFVHRRLNPRIVELGLHPDHSLRDRHLWKLAPLHPQCLALRPDCSLDYLIAPAVERRMLDLAEGREDVRAVYIFMTGVNLIDATGLEVLARLFEQYRKRGLAIHIVGAKLDVERRMRMLFSERDDIVFHRTEQEAVASMGVAAKP